MNTYIVIPARYDSTRLPGKPLVDLAGKPMIQHTYENASKVSEATVVIAPDDARIESAAKNFGANVCLTSKNHTSGTERIAEVIDKLKLEDDDIIVNLQCDEPFLPPEIVEQLVNNMKSISVNMATLCEPIDSLDDVFNPNNVKVVFDKDNYALYFSRAPIPWCRDEFNKQPKQLPKNVTYYRHIGIYAYRAGFVKRYVGWQPSILESTECLEQLRVLANGEKIHIDIAVSSPGIGIDTQDDLNKALELL